MSIIIALFSAVIIMSILLLHVTFYIEVDYQRQGADDTLTVRVYCWRKLILYQMQIPVISMAHHGRLWVETHIETKQGDMGSNSEAEIKTVWRWTKRYIHKPRLFFSLIHKLRKYIYYSRQLTKRLLDQVCCEKFYWNTRFGTSDAAVTGLVTGLLWSTKASLLYRLTKQIRFVAKPIICVRPNFESQEFVVEFKCIFSLRLGNVINAFLFVEKNINKGATAGG